MHEWILWVTILHEMLWYDSMKKNGILESLLSCHTSMTFYYMDYDMSNGMSFYEYSPCIRRKVIGFYKLHYCSSNEANEFFQILAYFTGH